jgi:hypothetical protein
MNPTIKASEEVIFDGNFESGNLDTVIKVNELEYDVFMRVDSNTRGHVQWFNFTVKNTRQKKIKINIVNFRKHKTLYDRVNLNITIGSEALHILDLSASNQRIDLVSRRFKCKI